MKFGPSQIGRINKQTEIGLFPVSAASPRIGPFIATHYAAHPLPGELRQRSPSPYAAGPGCALRRSTGQADGTIMHPCNGAVCANYGGVPSILNVRR